MDEETRWMEARPGADRDGRPGSGGDERLDWRREFRRWVSGLSPSTIADVIDELARELDLRRLGGHRALTEAAHRVRSPQGARIRQLVDEFLTVSPTPRGGGAGRGGRR